MGFFGNSSAYDKIDRDITAIADGSADLSHTVGSPGNDTAGRISGNINRFFSRVRTLISHSRERSISTDQSAGAQRRDRSRTGRRNRSRLRRGRRRSAQAGRADTSDKTKTIVGEVTRANGYIETSAADLTTMVGDFKRTTDQLSTISVAIYQLRESNQAIHREVEEIRDHSRDISGRMKQCLDSAKTLRESTEDLQCTLADFRTGNSMFDTLHDKVTGFRDNVGNVLQKMTDRGVNIFDQSYKEIPGSNPKRYTASYDSQCDAELTRIYDDLLRDFPGLTYSLSVDNNGYAPAHNSQFSNPPTGDPAVDLAKSRHKRIFNDPVGLKLAKNEKPSLFQTYVRDTGEILNDLSMPIVINGRHWGAVRVGFNTDLLK
jgi:methyl-accepting chemotaxis protein